MTSKKTKNKPLNQIVSLAAGHLFHDFYPAILAPLLPRIIDMLSISLTSAGLLTSMSRLPTLLNPLIGYSADKKGAKYFVIFAPAFSATFMCLIGTTSSYLGLAVLLILSGLSSTFFHASSPGLVAEASDQRKGFGMSLYMAGGGIGRSLGPLVVIWAVGLWGLEGIWRLMFLGWGISLFMLVHFHGINFKSPQKHSLSMDIPLFKRFFLPLGLVLILRSALTASLTTYLPVLMVKSGAPLVIAGAGLSILELSGVTGALILGPLSDRVGRTKVLRISIFLSAILVPLFLTLQGWKLFPVLILLGFFNISTGTIFLALVQDNFRDHRATGNSIYILISFLSNALMLILIGFIGDHYGLRIAYWISAGLALISIPSMSLLPSGSDHIISRTNQ
jgi:FSR family fosmidomycin resistance protein-like MFS transporter